MMPRGGGIMLSLLPCDEGLKHMQYGNISTSADDPFIVTYKLQFKKPISSTVYTINCPFQARLFLKQHKAPARVHELLAPVI